MAGQSTSSGMAFKNPGPTAATKLLSFFSKLSLRQWAQSLRRLRLKPRIGVVEYIPAPGTSKRASSDSASEVYNSPKSTRDWAMSEYQYYEFLAIDRPLTDEQMAELRSISSRAEITPTHFSNEYNYGDLKADPHTLLKRYFDAHVYVANWGTHQLSLRLPAELVEVDDLKRYCVSEQSSVEKTRDIVVLDIYSETEDYEGWVEGAGWMASLAPVRSSNDPRFCAMLMRPNRPAGPKETDDSETRPPYLLARSPHTQAKLYRQTRARPTAASGGIAVTRINR